MNRLLMWATTIGATVCALIAPGLAQEHIPVPLADASRPVTMNVHLMGGSITVRAYNGREVLVEAKSKVEDTKEKTHEGMHRIGGTGTDISIESDNNKVSISSHMGRPTDIVVQTPVNTSLNVRTLHGGGITIEGINGDVEAQALNGPVVVRNVSGTVVANSLNGGVTVVLKSVKAGSPMSFTSLNGNIDVTLPPNVAAEFNMKTTHGEIYSDFDVQLKSPVKPLVEESKTGKGKYKVKTDSTTSGTVNGGGPGYKFQTLNGNIYIRKAK